MIQRPALETDRLTLHAPDATDSAAMISFLATDRAAFYGGPMPDLQAWTKFAAYVGQWRLRNYGMFALRLKDGGKTVGMAGPYHPDCFAEPEMSWLITDSRFEGQGFAREACTAVLGHLFDDLGWSSVVSYIDHKNGRSRILAERLGARPDPASVSPFEGCVTYRHVKDGVTR